jgi:hypothetical protein
MKSNKKKQGVEDDSKQGTARHAHGHEIVTSYEGEGSWSVKVFHGQQLRQTITGQRYEGDAYWVGDDWAHIHRVLVPDSKVIGQEYAPVIFESGKELMRLACKRTAGEALEHAEQYIEAIHLADRERVAMKQTLRAEYILKMREFDAIEAGLEKKIADLKETLKLAQQRRADFKEECSNPQVTFNFVFDRKKAKQQDIEDARSMLKDLGAAPPKREDPRAGL